MFNKSKLNGFKDIDKYKFVKKSYFGGFTQAFCIGEVK